MKKIKQLLIIIGLLVFPFLGKAQCNIEGETLNGITNATTKVISLNTYIYNKITICDYSCQLNTIKSISRNDIYLSMRFYTIKNFKYSTKPRNVRINFKNKNGYAKFIVFKSIKEELYKSDESSEIYFFDFLLTSNEINILKNNEIDNIIIIDKPTKLSYTFNPNPYILSEAVKCIDDWNNEN